MKVGSSVHSFAGITVSILTATVLALFSSCSTPDYNVEANYVKSEVRIPMRDGVELFATIYVPRDTSKEYPFLIKRSPYSSGPYEEGAYRSHVGPNGSSRFAEEGYIFVYQDVRGRFMSDGQFLNMTPNHPGNAPGTTIDESSDMYDTVEWLINNIQPNNGRVGIWGISYPGFYAAASVIDSHPAVKASSPQAPIADWFVGDDFHHNGAFYLQDAFRFFRNFEHPEPNPTTNRRSRFDFDSENAYQFFLDMGPLKNANEKYFNGEIAFWDSLMQNGVNDRFWQSRNIIPHMKNVTTSVMTVAGLFDAEDPYGPVSIYRSTEINNPGTFNTLVLGPWFHGGWVRGPGSSLGNISFGAETSIWYQENIDLPFFNYFLKDKGDLDLSEVTAFSTGSNEWHQLDAWPPPGSEAFTWYLGADGSLEDSAPTGTGMDSYVSDPANPVPYTKEVRIDRTREYMVEDQRFAAAREDVLVYQTEVLTEDMTFAGPITVDLFVSTTGTDADFVVKLIDVFPDDEPEWQNSEDKYLSDPMAGYQMMVRGEVFRSKFRNSFEFPEPLVPEQIARVKFNTPDIFHTFKTGHRIMVQVQSSWFPLVDRNPQTFVDIYSAEPSDFQSATHTIHRSVNAPSSLTINRVY
ncbi:MAG: CocE/NonD family hydrolase [Rhodothermia bacterium]|nr:MAG: CocE/NonD family hydrolase [Rhodothermia bacterium]